MTLLGTQIKNRGLCFDSNIDTIGEKVRRQINFWNRFNLSLPGRISVAKTFLYSQINYLGCFMPFPLNSLNGISALIEGFVKGKLKIARNRLYQHLSEGGVGIFNLTDFLGAQCCSWVKRAATGNELWKKHLRSAGEGNVYCIRKHRIDKKSNPILFHIAENYEKFYLKFCVVKENFKKAYVFENPVFTFEGAGNNLISKTFFGEENFLGSKKSITNLKFSDIVNDAGNRVEYNAFLLNTGIALPMDKFERLVSLALRCYRSYTKMSREDKKTTTIEEFFGKIKKGCKPVRRIITGSNTNAISQNILRFAEKVDTVINLEKSVILNSQWGYSYLDNSTKTFLFKLHNNQLGVNSRVAHFVRGHDNNCTFCTLNRVPEEHRETVSHLFFDCATTERLLEEFFSLVFNVQYRMVTRSEYFAGFNLEFEPDNKILNVIVILVKKFIWDGKLRFTLPRTDALVTSINTEFGRIIRTNGILASNLNKSRIFNANFNFRF